MQRELAGINGQDFVGFSRRFLTVLLALLDT